MGRTLLNLDPPGADHHEVRFVGRVLIKLVMVLAGIAAGVALWVVGIRRMPDSFSRSPMTSSFVRSRPMPVLP
jgi:hypothetical protein